MYHLKRSGWIKQPLSLNIGMIMKLLKIMEEKDAKKNK
jgi:hypothetical protein